MRQFRSTPAAIPHADSDFNAFLQGNSNGSAPTPMSGAMRAITNPATMGRETTRQPPHIGTQRAPYDAAWTEQFRSMNMAPAARGALRPGISTAPPGAGAASANGVPFVTHHDVPAFRYLPPDAHFGPHYSTLHGPPAFSMPPRSAPQTNGGLSEAELDAKFAQFQAEYGLAAGDKLEDEFEDEMDSWMSLHGPDLAQNDVAGATAERPANSAERQPSEPEETRTEQDDLAKTAHEILQSVSSNNSDKFKQSSFLGLMRRITAGEVVLQGDDLVETRTGQPVTSVKSENDAASPTPRAAADTQTQQ